MVTNQDAPGTAFGVTGGNNPATQSCLAGPRAPPLALASPLHALGSPVRAKRRTPRAKARAKQLSRPLLSGARAAPHATP
jgi:hypothetical protein